MRSSSLRLSQSNYPIAPAQTVTILNAESFMTREQILDLYFMDARSKLIDLAAFLDRVERGQGKEDFRMRALREALNCLAQPEGNRAKNVLLALSDSSREPIAAATTKAACGAWNNQP